MNVRQMFLLVVAVGLIPVAMSYGIVPQKSLGYLFDVSVENVNSIHIFRALMGLYLGFALFWILGAFNVQLRQAALYSLVVFMFGVAAGRGLSVVVDGMPHWLLFAYIPVELVFAGIGVLLLKKPE